MNAVRAIGGIGPSAFDVRHYVEARSMLAVLKPYRASRELEAFIVARAPAHHATPDAPSTYAELRAWGASAKRADAGAGIIGTWPRASLPVFDGGCDRTIYSRAPVNHAFRAWHDALHLMTGAKFDAACERTVSDAGVNAARAAGLSQVDCDALAFDVWGQFLFADCHGGEFPADQSLFVAACFAYGMETAAAMPAELFA